MASPLSEAASLPLLRRLLLSALSLLRHEDSSLHWWIAGSVRLLRRTLPPGTLARSSATSLRGLPRINLAGEQQLGLVGIDG